MQGTPPPNPLPISDGEGEPEIIADELSGSSSPAKRRKGLGGLIFPSALSAILLSFCFPFASAWWLAWFALVPLYYALSRANGNPRSGFLAGFWFGLTLHLVGVFWMNKLGTVPWVGVAIFESFAFAIFGAIAAPLLSPLPMRARPLVFAALWTCLEYVRTLSELAFPWFPTAATQVPVLPMVQIVAVTGQWGLSFAIALVNGLLFQSYQAHQLRATTAFRWFAGTAVYVPLALTIYGWFCLAALDKHEISGAGNEISTRKIGIVQGNIGKVPENAGLDSISDYRWSAIETYLQMTRVVAGESPLSPGTPWVPFPPADGGERGVPEAGDTIASPTDDTPSPLTPLSPPSAGGKGLGDRGAANDLAFILWPETVVPGYLLQEPSLQSLVATLARETKTNLLVGTMNAGRKDEKFNSVVHLDADGDVQRVYAKQRLVPMGEFFLFRDILGDIYDKYEVPNDDLTPGREPGVFTVGEGDKATKVGMLICYEAVFPYISRNRVRDGAQVLVQSTSDQTFDETPNPQQHADLCVLRAVETRRYFVRAGSTGLSQIIDAGGRVRRNVPSLKAGTIVDTIVLRQGETFFVRFGDWFVGLCAVITASGVGFALLQKRPAKVAVPQTPSTGEDALPGQTNHL